MPSKMEALQFLMMRQVTPAQKMEMLGDLNDTARLLAQAGLRSLYPRESESIIRRRLAALLLGEELALKVYGDFNEVT